MKIAKAITYVEQAIKDYEFEIENETTKLMKDTYSDVMEHYKTALIALKYLQKELQDGNQLSKYTEKEMLKGAEDYVEGVFRNREKKVEQLDGYSFEVGV